MKSEKEKIFENHIVNYLTQRHGYTLLSAADCTDKAFHIISSQLLSFINATQAAKYNKLKENYKTDTDREIFEALKAELARKPLWVIIRNGIMVRNISFDLYYPRPRSNNSQTSFFNYSQNLFTVKSQYHFSSSENDSIDLVLFLNGLPIITIELKHEDEKQNVYDAVSQYNIRPQENKIFTLPFLHIAADTSEVKIATNPFAEGNFIPFNQGLTNNAENQGEYPIEFLYKNVLSKDWVLEYISFFLIYIPANQSITNNSIQIISPERTIFPRYHQLRSNHRLAQNITDNFETQNTLGLKYLISHSAGSGKTLTICWLADRIDSLYTTTNHKIFDMVIVLTDRRSLDKNIKDELVNFVHLSSKTGLTESSDQLKKYINQRKSIIVSTIQKFSYIQELIKDDESLKQLRIAFIIDEAHRSQDGKMANNVKAIFTDAAKPDNEEMPTDEDEIIEKARQVNISNQVLVAFTATPIQTTVDYFGAAFDEYTEDEAIKEGYILDVANNIVSYQTLYNLKSRTVIPDDELYPAGVVHKALRDVAYRDPELIQYKSEVILKYFEDKIKPTINGTGKAMVVSSSRAAGLLYFEALKEKIEKRNLSYKVLFAFSDFTDDKGNDFKEETLNELNTIHGGKKIEDVFDQDDYRIIVVANKFQTGFNQPKLAAMFLDKPVRDVNAVQTLSRLNRKCFGKDSTTVVDFTNSVQNIFDAFRRYRKGSRFQPQEPNPQTLETRYNEFLNMNIFNETEIITYTLLVTEATTNPAKDADLMSLSNNYREKFKKIVIDKEAQKEIVNFLNRYVSDFYFISQFFQLPKHIVRFALFAEVIADKLFKKGSVSSLKEHLKNLLVEKSTVRYRGIISNLTVNDPPPAPRGGAGGGNPTQPPRASIPEVMADLRALFQITDEEAILINEVIDELMKDTNVVTNIVNNLNNPLFMNSYYNTLKQRVINYYLNHNWEERLIEGPYVSAGGIIEYIVQSVVRLCSTQAA
jgi:type I restriction enzyme R subunit